MSLSRIYKITEGSSDYSISHLGNGFTTVIDRRSGLRGLFKTETGDFVSGDLNLSRQKVRSLMQQSPQEKY